MPEKTNTGFPVSDGLGRLQVRIFLVSNLFKCLKIMFCNSYLCLLPTFFYDYKDH